MTETLTGYDLADRYRRTEGRVLLTGIPGPGRIVIEQLRRDQQAGLNTAAFLAGYPGSPLGGLDQEDGATPVPSCPTCPSSTSRR